jgi:hypothetical protein
MKRSVGGGGEKTAGGRNPEGAGSAQLSRAEIAAEFVRLKVDVIRAC